MKLQISIEGKTYEVDVEVPEEEPAPHAYLGYRSPYAGTCIPSAPAPIISTKPNGKPVADESKVCRSPIAGVVIRVNVQPGQQLQPNDLLIVLEAMKMETNVTAPVAGKVKAINVQPSDGVQVNQVLVELE